MNSCFGSFANQGLFLDDSGSLSGSYNNGDIYGGTSTARVIPEPLTILGAGTAVAFGTAFKRKLVKAKKK